MKFLDILFVCIGNTCRSPMAESIMRKHVIEQQLSWKIDSAGLRSWNVGRMPEDRCIQVLNENGIKTKHYAREITMEDLETFDYILCMDEYNLRELILLSKKCKKKVKAKIELLGSYFRQSKFCTIEDPHFTPGVDSFRRVYYQIDSSCQNFIKLHKFNRSRLYGC